MSLEADLNRAVASVVETARQLRDQSADAKAGYADVLRQVMQHSVDLGLVRTEVRGWLDDAERKAAKRHDELLAAILAVGASP